MMLFFRRTFTDLLTAHECNRQTGLPWQYRAIMVYTVRAMYYSASRGKKACVP